MGKKMFIGFWMRLLADLLDVAILGLFGYLLAIPFKELFYLMGDGGLILGILISFLYSGILNSRRGSGQTLAKMLLRQQVVRLDGSYLSVTRSFIRHVITAAVFYHQCFALGILHFFPSLDTDMFRTILGMVVITLFMIHSVLIAVHPLRRGLDDLLVGSIVIRANQYCSQTVELLINPAKSLRAGLIGLLVLVVLLSGYSMAIVKSAHMQPEIELLFIQKKMIENETGLVKVVPRLIMGSETQKDGRSKNWTALVVDAFLLKYLFDDEVYRREQVRKAVDIIVKNYSHVNRCDYLGAKITSGYSIGIWTSFETVPYFFKADGTEIEVERDMVHMKYRAKGRR